MLTVAILIFVAGAFLDWYTTKTALVKHPGKFRERNPVVNWCIEKIGTYEALTLLKLAVAGALAALDVPWGVWMAFGFSETFSSYAAFLFLPNGFYLDLCARRKIIGAKRNPLASLPFC